MMKVVNTCIIIFKVKLQVIVCLMIVFADSIVFTTMLSKCTIQ